MVQDDLHICYLFLHVLYEKQRLRDLVFLCSPQFQQCFGELRHLFQHHVNLRLLPIHHQGILQDWPPDSGLLDHSAGLSHGRGFNGNLDARSQSLHI